MGYGTKVVIRSTVEDGITIQYYRVITLLATSYSPCRSGTSKCSYGTSSGLPVKRGTVAMVYSWYLAFGFDKLYIPGYGYAKVSKTMRKNWGALIEQYLHDSSRLAGLVALFDARRDPTEEDQDWLAWLGEWAKASLVVLTKCDKLSSNERASSLKRWGQAARDQEVPPLLFSSTTGEGKDQLWQWIDHVRLAQIRLPKKR